MASQAREGNSKPRRYSDSSTEDVREISTPDSVDGNTLAAIDARCYQRRRLIHSVNHEQRHSDRFF